MVWDYCKEYKWKSKELCQQSTCFDKQQSQACQETVPWERERERERESLPLLWPAPQYRWNGTGTVPDWNWVSSKTEICLSPISVVVATTPRPGDKREQGVWWKKSVVFELNCWICGDNQLPFWADNKDTKQQTKHTPTRLLPWEPRPDTQDT